MARRWRTPLWAVVVARAVVAAWRAGADAVPAWLRGSPGWRWPSCRCRPSSSTWCRGGGWGRRPSLFLGGAGRRGRAAHRRGAVGGRPIGRSGRCGSSPSSRCWCSAGDVLTGSGLQLGSVFGQNPVVGGRFYGLGNTSFALYGLAVLVVVGWVAASGRSRRVAAVGRLALVVLVAALAVEALPSLGRRLRRARPGCCSVGCSSSPSAAGVRLTWGRVLVAVVGAGALAALVAVLDWLRPAESRTHLGEFVESVVSGEAGAVVGRKLAQNVTNLGSPPLLAIAVATVVLVVVAWRTGWRPVRCRGRGAARRGGDGRGGVPRQRLRARHPGVRGARAGAAARGGRSFAPEASPSQRERKWREREGSGIGRESCDVSGPGSGPARRARRGCRRRPWGG